MTRILPGVIAMAIVVVASNYLVQEQFLIFNGLLTWGAFTYPLAFLVTDIMNRVYGARPARQVIFFGVIVGIICSFLFPNVAVRIAIGSACAFTVAQLLDVKIFNTINRQTWWKAPLFSTIISSIVDSVIFFTIAFAPIFNAVSASATQQIGWAQADGYWITLAVADWGVKIGIALIALVPFRMIVALYMPRKSDI